MNKPGQAGLNRTERTGWLEHDRKHRTAGKGQTRQDSHKRTDSQHRPVIKGSPVQVSLKINLDDNTKLEEKVITQPEDSICESFSK